MSDDEKNAVIPSASEESHAVIPSASEESIEEIKHNRDEYLAGWKRALADYENLQKQNGQLRVDDRRRIVTGLAYELLPVIDNIDVALRHAPKDIDKNWFAGIEHIARQFDGVLASLGIAPIDAVGKIFDPHEHESGGAQSEKEKEDHAVLEEIVRGWKFGDTVIRPAKVIVNQK